MLSRLALLLITLFWLVMNFLLWRSEFGGRNQLGATVPVEVVWKKILTAPDNSSLDILHHGKKIGTCAWVANAGQELATGKINTYDPRPEGILEKFASYRLDFEGNLALPDISGHLRFDFHVRLDTNQDWQEFNLRLILRPNVWEIHSLAAEQSARLKVENDAGKSERVFRFADLQNPRFLLQEFELPLPLLGLLGASAQPGAARAAGPPALGLNWEARNHWISLGHASVRAYRLRAALFDRYQVVVLVSRVGEILRVELPDDVILANDQVPGL